MGKLIIIDYLNWHFIEATRDIALAWKNFLWFGLNYFSVPILVKTFFSHWHKYYFSYGDKWNPQRWIEAFTFNSMSRIIGAMLRFVLIISGILFELGIFLIGLIGLIAWICAPIILLAIFIFAFGLLI